MRVSLKSIHQNDEVEELSNTYQRYSFIERVLSDESAFDEYGGVDKSTGDPVRILVVNIRKLTDEQKLDYAAKLTLAKKLDHPTMVTLKDFWFESRRLFVVMDHIKGRRVNHFIEEGRLKLVNTLKITTQISELLEYLHREKLYHTALRPPFIFVEQDFRVALRPLYVDNILLDVSITEDDDLAFLELPEGHKSGSLMPTECELDIEALGAIICYLSTGYNPIEMDPRRWCSYGLEPDLEEAVSRATRREGYYAYTMLSELGAVLELLHSNNLTESLGKECIQSKLHHFKSSQRWAQDTTNLSVLKRQATQVLEADQSKKSQHKLLDDRYEVGESVVLNEFISVFEARDQTQNNERVWIHLYHFSGSPDWSYEFRQVTYWMQQVSHPHIGQVLGSAVLEKSAYIATEQEEGELLRDFVKRHRFTKSDVSQFCLQIGDAIREANKGNFQIYTLSMDTICVYKHPDEDGYFFRIIGLGVTRLLALDFPENAWLDKIKVPEAYAPEMHINNPQGFLTTQFIFGSLIFSLLANGHPNTGLSLEKALKRNCETEEMSILRYRSVLETGFVDWLHRLIAPEFRLRYQTPEQMLDELKKVIRGGY